MPENHPHDVRSIGAEGHTDADLMRALRGDEGKHSINADETKYQGRGSECAEEGKCKARARIALHVEHVAQCSGVDDGLILNDRIDRPANGIEQTFSWKCSRHDQGVGSGKD